MELESTRVSIVIPGIRLEVSWSMEDGSNCLEYVGILKVFLDECTEY